MTWWTGLAAIAWVGFSSHLALAFPETARTTGAACASCHTNVAGGADLSDAGKAFKAEASKAPAASEGATYVGANKCRMCHTKQFKAWSETPHAAALANMAKADAKTVADIAAKLKIEVKDGAAKTDGCISCHVTGFKLAGGFPAADSTRHANVSMVGCESCHGPGSKHIASSKETKKTTISKAVGTAMCMQCHTPDMSPNYKFDTYKLKVHPVATP
jgi:hypothetical protein